jgi:PII-like signaling protein
MTMTLYKKKRIEIVVEAPLKQRMIKILDDANVGGYTVLAAAAGRGADGVWDREGLVGRVGAMVVIFCYLDEARVESVLGAVFKLIQKQIGIVTISDVEVVRPEAFR